MPLRVKVIVLSYNGTADTLACLDSLRQEGDKTYDVLVVDNASTDGAPAAIRAHHPDVTLIELPENRGWAGGNNVGIAAALEDGAEAICLLNNDTIVSPAAIDTLAAVARAHAPCLVHPCIDFADAAEGVQLDPIQPRPADTVTRVGTDGILFELDFAYGACLMVSARVFRDIGLFDERFFLQLEETDFYLRARRRGVRSLCTRGARIVHAESRGFGGRATPMKTYYMVRNTLLLTEKHRRKPAAAFQSLRSLYWSVSRLAAQAGAGRPSLAWSRSRHPFCIAVRAGLCDYIFRRFGRIAPATLRAIAP